MCAPRRKNGCPAWAPSGQRVFAFAPGVGNQISGSVILSEVHPPPGGRTERKDLLLRTPIFPQCASIATLALTFSHASVSVPLPPPSSDSV